MTSASATSFIEESEGDTEKIRKKEIRGVKLTVETKKK